MRKNYYNIHNLVTVNLYYKKNKDISYFDQRLKRFKSLEKFSSDINVYFNVLPAGTTKPLLRDQLNKKGVIYDKRRIKLAKWEAYVYNIDGDTTDLFFFGNKVSLKYLFFNFLEPIINYKLLNKGFCLVHASCFSFGDSGYLVNAYPSSGKTSILLKMLKKGADYLSDEMTIISRDGLSYSYPTFLCLHDYNFNKNFCKNLETRKIFKIYISKLIRILTRGIVNPSIELDPTMMLSGGRVIDVCKIDFSFIIDENSVDILPKKRIEESIIKINKWQYRYFNELVNNYMKIDDKTKLKKYWPSMAAVIKDFCSEVDTIIINNADHFEKIKKTINKDQKHEG